MDYLKPDLFNILSLSVEKYKNIKIQISPCIQFMQKSPNRINRETLWFNSYTKFLFNANSIPEIINEIIVDIKGQIQKFERYGSGWILEMIKGLDLRVGKYSGVRANKFIPVPYAVYSKKCVINVQNNDEKCFLWSILSILHPAEDHVSRASSYREHVSKYTWDENLYPMSLANIPKFEEMNKIVVNVFGWDCTDKCSLFKFLKIIITMIQQQ